MKTQKELPHVIEMEKELLSMMMFKGGAAIPKIAGLIREDDFYRPEHKILFRTFMEIYREDQPANLLTLIEKLRQANELDNIGLQYLYALSEIAHTDAYAVSFAQTIREKSILRQIIVIGEEIVAEAYSNRLTAQELLELTEKRILAVSSISNQSDFRKVSDVLQSSFERIQHIHNNPGALRGIPTGLIDLEKVLNGMHRADLILLAARPSMGKTALALNIAVNAAVEGNFVAVFSLEMSREQIGNRLLSSASGVDSMHLNTGNLTEGDMRDLIDALEELSKLKMFIDDTAGISILELRTKARRLKHEQGLDLIVLDYLQLMQGQREKNFETNRQQEISDISRSLKALARELDVPILALSQLSRNVEMRAEKKPQLSDLRESGSLEQDADIVMFLYRDEYYNRDDSEQENVAELIIAKNRNGPTTSVRLQFQKEILLFRNLTREQR